MKKSIVVVLFTFCLLPSAFCQIKVLKATAQKMFGGMGGITMSYILEFKNKKNAEVVIDSVKCKADNSKVDFNFSKSDKGIYQITFSQGLKKPAKCPTCPDIAGTSNNFTKGVIMYYKKGEKRSACKVKKFKLLPDLMMP